ncbi:MAG: hypothetical protein K2H70_04245, partial [Bacteroidales bacterium]|nr:hypothetical protein [Bacteroidales bacterium]
MDNNEGRNDSIFRSPYHLFVPGDKIQLRMISNYRCLWKEEAESLPIVIPAQESIDFLSIMPDTSVCYGDSIRIAAYGAERYNWNPIYAPGNDTTYNYYWRYEYDTADWHRDSTWSALKDLMPGTPYDTAHVVNDSVWSYFYTGTLTVRDSVTDSLMTVVPVLRAETDSMPWVKPLETTWYKVMGWNEKGCATTKRIKVEVLPLPEPKVGPDYKICYGDSITLTALYGGKQEDTTHTYDWHTLEDSTLTYSGATVRIAPDSTHTYVVTETAPTGCFMTDTITIAVYPYPTPYFEPKDTSVCRNRELIYTDTSAYDSTWTYTWTPSSRLTRLMANGSSVRFASSDTGSYTYYVEAKTLYGCARRDTLQVRVESHHVTAYIVDETEQAIAGDTLCKFDSALYVVKGENWGENPTFEWFVDNVKQPASGDTLVYVAETDGRRAIRCLVKPGTGLCPDVAELYTGVVTVTVFPIDSAGVDMIVDGGYTVENDTLHLCAYDTVVTFRSVYTLAGKDPGVTYRWMRNGDTVSSARDQRISGLKTNDKIYVYATSGLLCAHPAVGADSLTVYVHDRAMELIWNPDTDTVGVCSRSENVISVSGGRDYSWSPTTNMTCRSALCDTIAVRAPDATASRWLYLSCTDSYGCRVSDSIYIYGLNNAEPDALEMCYGDTVVYDLSEDYKIYDSVVWEPADYLSDPHSLSPSVMAPTADLAYTLHLFHKQSGCGIDLHPTVKVRPYLGIALSVTDSIPCAHDSIFLSVNPDGVAAARLQGAHYAYSVVPARSASQLQDTARQWMWADSACTVYVTVTDRFGCRNTDSLRLAPIPYDTLKVSIDGADSRIACSDPIPAVAPWPRTAVGLSVAGDGLVNNSGANSWSSDAFGGDSIPARGELRYTVTGNEAGSMVGLSYVDYPNNTLYIDYAFYMTNYGGRPYRLYIYERGAYLADAGTYNVGDQLVIERNAGYVSYYRSGELVHRSVEHGSGVLFGDVATYYAHNQLGRIEILNVSQSYRLTSTVLHGGDALAYEWFVNGTLRGTDSILPATVQLHSFDTVVLRVTSSFKCPACPVVSDTVILDEIDAYNCLELDLSEQTHGCTGDSTYFTVHTLAAPSGAQLTYRWFRNGFLVAETTDSVRGFENVVQGELFRAEAYITNLNCVLNHRDNPAHTPIIKTERKPIQPLGINLDIYPHDTICRFTTAHFNVVAANGGDAPTVIWFLNDREETRERTYTTDSLQDGDQVFVRVKPSADIQCPDRDSIDSRVMIVSVHESPVVRIPQNDTLVDYGAEVFISAEVTSTRPYTFEWLPSYDLMTPDMLATIAKPRSTHRYNIRAVNDLGCYSNEESILVEVRVCPYFTARTANVDACENDTAAMTVYVADYSNSTHTYVWQVSTDFGATYADIAASDSRFVNRGNTLFVPNVTTDMDQYEGMAFRCRVSSSDSSCETVYSDPCYLHVKTVPAFSIDLQGPAEGCAGQDLDYVAEVKGLDGESYDLAWYLNGRLLAQGANVRLTAPEDGDRLRVVLTHATNHCVDRMQAGDSLQLAVHAAPVLTLCPDTAVFRNDSARLYASVTANGPATFG